MTTGITYYTNKSVLTGAVHMLPIPLDGETFDRCMAEYQQGALIQHAFPMLSFEEREFIKTGITPQEWNELCAVSGED